MTASLLPAALRAGPGGLYAIEAATGLIIARESWLARDDFACFIHAGNSISDPGTELASIDWEAAITALDAGELPSSGGERRMLRLAASLADQGPRERQGHHRHRRPQRRLLVKAVLKRSAGWRQCSAASTPPAA